MKALHKGGRTQTEVEKMREAKAKFGKRMNTREDCEPDSVPDWKAQNIPFNGTPVFRVPKELMRYIH